MLAENKNFPLLWSVYKEIMQKNKKIELCKKIVGCIKLQSKVFFLQIYNTMYRYVTLKV